MSTHTAVVLASASPRRLELLRGCGYDVRVVDEQAKEVAPNQMGSIVVKLPLPPSCLPTLWEADARMRESYLAEFPGFYKTADAGYIDDDGYVYVMGRTDDIINVAGHRLSTGAMEEVLASHRDVAECAVIGADSSAGPVEQGRRAAGPDTLVC